MASNGQSSAQEQRSSACPERDSLPTLLARAITQAVACELARRIKDQRELARQLADRRNLKHARRLMRLNRELRKRLIGIVEQAGLDKDILVFK